MSRRTKYSIGPLRIRAAKILSENLGFEVRPEDIVPATGAWRTNWRLDVYRWELFTYKSTMPIVAGCWETLTYFVKHAKTEGCCIDDNEVKIGRAKQ